MECPACSGTLFRVELQDVTVDVCKASCGGVWFDNFELEKMDEAHEHIGEPLLSIELDVETPVEVDHDERRKCPRCKDIVMMRHFHNAKNKVEIDLCPGCNGTWLDMGELRTIRKSTEAEERKAANQLFNDLFADDLAAQRAQSEKELSRAKRVAHMLRFITPSWYIPGKQSGGAF